MNVVLHPEANKDLEDAVYFYDSKETAIADAFLQAVQRTILRLKTFPHIGKKDPLNCRSFPVRGFPYDVLYRVSEETLFIAAVAHHRRKPGYWRGRL